MCALVRYLRGDISPSGRLGSGTVPVMAIPLALGRAAACAVNGPAVQRLTWTPTVKNPRLKKFFQEQKPAHRGVLKIFRNRNAHLYD